ncbi:endolysin [Vibrio phage Vc1]|uniref:Lysozyme n=1 Tax=Vibrio phage Vc1 TaxID=1480731 RepID=A0A9X9TDA2_9CAUD|nr:endolysin [Vibrio virus 2019VC1]
MSEAVKRIDALRMVNFVYKDDEKNRERFGIIAEKHRQVGADTVDRLVKVEIPDSMRAAIYPQTYHTGSGAFRGSTILKEVNKGKPEQSCNPLWNWVYYTDPKTDKKKKSKGLQNARAVDCKYRVRDLKR